MAGDSKFYGKLLMPLSSIIVCDYSFSLVILRDRRKEASSFGVHAELLFVLLHSGNYFYPTRTAWFIWLFYPTLRTSLSPSEYKSSLLPVSFLL